MIGVLLITVFLQSDWWISANMIGTLLITVFLQSDWWIFGEYDWWTFWLSKIRHNYLFRNDFFDVSLIHCIWIKYEHFLENAAQSWPETVSAIEAQVLLLSSPSSPSFSLFSSNFLWRKFPKVQVWYRCQNSRKKLFGDLSSGLDIVMGKIKLIDPCFCIVWYLYLKVYFAAQDLGPRAVSFKFPMFKIAI